MIYSVNFWELAEKINPFSISKYLEDTGWQFIPRKSTDVKVFQHKIDGQLFQLTIPMDKKLSDFKEATYNAVKIIAQFERKPLEQVFLYLLNPNSDILKIRIEAPKVEAGNILLDDAINVYQNAKKLLGATALDILHPRRYHQGRMDDSIIKFLSECKFGQTEVGSYVISVICPFSNFDEDGYNQLSIFSDAEQYANSLTRQVTSRIIENIDTIKGNIDAGRISQLIDNDIMISANFYEALMGMNLGTEGTNVEFWTEWSPVVKPTITAQKSPIVLTHDYYQPIEAVKNSLKGRTKKATKIVGRIKRMESLPDAKQRKNGKITVVYLNEDDSARQVSAQLEKTDYQRAIEAHENGWYVELVGELSDGHTAEMACESFTVIN